MVADCLWFIWFEVFGYRRFEFERKLKLHVGQITRMSERVVRFGDQSVSLDPFNDKNKGAEGSYGVRGTGAPGIISWLNI